MSTPGIHPKREDVFERIPQSLPVGGLEIQRINILIFLGRILRILNRPIGALLEEFRMLFDPGMIRSALERNIQGNLHLQLFGPLDQVREILHGAQFGMDRGMTPFVGADRPGAAVVSRGGFDRVIFAFAKTLSDGRDRREVEDVEAHVRHIVQPAGYVAERAMLSWNG